MTFWTKSYDTSFLDNFHHKPFFRKRLELDKKMATASPSSSDPPTNIASGEEKDKITSENSEKTEKPSVNSDSEDKKSEDDSATRAFECNICLDTGKIFDRELHCRGQGS